MKRIALFCDGTWNRSDAHNATSVVRLAQAVMPTAPDGTKQQVFYMPGVGSGRGATKLARAMDRIGGGAFGWGLTENIHEAFRNLVFCYEPGDEIFVFGFSRGAYTARSLCGLIRSTGLPDRSQIPFIPTAIERYRDRRDITRPDSEESHKFRAVISPRMATSRDEIDWREKNYLGQAGLLTVNYLGVWDTVGAMGLPGVLGAVARRVNEKYTFHDQKLTSLVTSARHAVALDELRRLFPPTLWDKKIDRMNGDVTGDARPYQQKWFPGNHGIVGGSGPVPGLSADVSLWMIEGAERAGLVFDPLQMNQFRDRADPLARNTRLSQTSGLTNLFGKLLGPREGPTRLEDVSDAARLRADRLGYAPQSLSQVIREMRANPPGRDS